MGDGRYYNSSKEDFSSYLFTTASAKITINGITGKMITSKSDIEGEHPHLPAYSNSCDVYLYRGKDGFATQAKVYQNHTMVLDFDWGHTHENKRNGVVVDTFPEGVVHVQEYVVSKVKDPTTGKYTNRFKRKSNKARFMSDEEIQKYGPLILKFNSNVKFRI